jgi:hypothetical protein
VEFTLYTGASQLQGMEDRGAAAGADWLVLAPFKRRDSPEVLLPHSATFRWALAWLAGPTL